MYFATLLVYYSRLRTTALDRLHFLRNVKLFDLLSDAMLQRIAAAVTEVKFVDGEYITTQGEVMAMATSR